jgi:hypothetical protein
MCPVEQTDQGPMEDAVTVAIKARPVEVATKSLVG